MSDRIWREAEHHETIAFERSPLLTPMRRRPIGRPAWFAIGVAIGVAIEALLR